MDIHPAILAACALCLLILVAGPVPQDPIDAMDHPCPVVNVYAYSPYYSVQWQCVPTPSSQG